MAGIYHQWASYQQDSTSSVYSLFWEPYSVWLVSSCLRVSELISNSVIGATIAQVVYVLSASLASASWQATLCTEIVQCATITTACIPHLHPFLVSLESGWLRADEFRRQSTKDLDPSTAPSKSSVRRSVSMSSAAAKPLPSLPSNVELLPTHVANGGWQNEVGALFKARTVDHEQGNETARVVFEGC